MSKIVKFIGQLHNVKISRPGQGRIELDFGRDAFEEIIEIQRFFKDNNIEVAVILTPLEPHIIIPEGKSISDFESS